MFIVEVGSAITTGIALLAAFRGDGHTLWFTAVVSFWLWLTVIFANIAEAVAEGRGKAQADTLRATRTTTLAHRRTESGAIEEVAASDLQRGDRVLVVAGEVIPADGDVVEGAGSVDESAITGESAPVIREAGGDRSAVTGGTRLLSDELVVLVTQEPGKSFLDRMIALVEGAERRKTPNEIALNILLAGSTIVFVVACATLAPFASYAHTGLSTTVLIALLVALIPTTIGALLSCIGIAGHGPAGAPKRAGDVGPRGRGRRRHRRAAARQDRHDHARQPPGIGVHPRRGCGGARSGRGRPAGVARRRDAGGPLHRRFGQAVRNPRARALARCRRSSSPSPHRPG